MHLQYNIILCSTNPTHTNFLLLLIYFVVLIVFRRSFFLRFFESQSSTIFWLKRVWLKRIINSGGLITDNWRFLPTINEFVSYNFCGLKKYVVISDAATYSYSHNGTYYAVIDVWAESSLYVVLLLLF